MSGRKLLVLASDDSGYTAVAEWLCDRFYEYADRTAGTIILPSPFDYGGTTGVMPSPSVTPRQLSSSSAMKRR